MPDRAPVQAGPKGPAGTISWGEHLRFWEAYARRYGNRQSAERIAERGGFGHGEIEALTGGVAQTFVRSDPAKRECDAICDAASGGSCFTPWCRCSCHRSPIRDRRA